jgi:hypothetical protein
VHKLALYQNNVQKTAEYFIWLIKDIKAWQVELVIAKSLVTLISSKFKLEALFYNAD